MEGDRLKQLAIRWEFTETVVQMLMHEYDLDKNGSLDPTEKQALEGFFAAKLAESGYFTTLTINRRTVTGTVYDNQRLTMDTSTPGFEYEIPLSQAIEDGLDLVSSHHRGWLNHLFSDKDVMSAISPTVMR
jgi:ABC-type uncharacterized transport system substrate-binding protein